jgi:polyisoprenoid-binding protein YceI
MPRLLFALPLMLAVPLLAQQPGPIGSRNPAAVTAGTYAVDPDHTMIRWTVDHLGISPYFGIFGSVTGTLRLDPTNIAATKVDIVIPVSKVTTASAGLTAHLLRPGPAAGKPDFFGPAPADARFVSTAVSADVQGGKARLIGNLTLNGVTRPVTLDVVFHGAGKAPAAMGGKENVGFTAKGTIRRSDFGLGLGVPMVSDDVELDITAAFQK